MATVLITGASGFIGAHLARRLAAEGHKVRASGRDARRLSCLADSAEIVIADLVDDDLEQLTADCDVVVHAAAFSTPWGTPKAFWDANVLATERLLHASRAQGVARFIHIGSPSIYFRFADQLAVTEQFVPPQRWITQYAYSKWVSECRVREAAATGLPAIVLRPRAVFGEGDRAILPRLLAVAERGWFPLVHGGQAMIDVTHVDNLVDLIAHCINSDIPVDGRAYNVSNGTPVRVRYLLEKLFAALDKDVRLISLPRTPLVGIAGIAEMIARLRPGQPEPRLTRYGLGVLGWSQTLDISRAQRELAYQPRMSIEAGLDRYAHWWRQHGHS